MYKIDEVAQKVKMTKRALRYYEELGLVSPSGRTEGGYRMYTDADVERILHVKDMRDLLGASLAEIKDMVELGRLYEEQRDFYNENYKNRDLDGPELLKRIEMLQTLEDTLTPQRHLLKSKIERMQELLLTFDERLERIVSKRNELTSKYEGGNN
ncbi:MerR family transcriptional regulator [Brevibacillus choshinensis]|uniref:MerR family transcriptional regulator n=1 Tax=Brevibacillus choshinensis TaxID=54911 RepID=UPI002E1C229D|nr:MerR family transcriptional regulator [Brevibacillus choshinensis]MED4752453.1 MerR family transcriptional regulator [Brevibacillus choshinensis]MED4785062.1 MerR family transcriptional regulator [Brevibacillus choshinensis]